MIEPLPFKAKNRERIILAHGWLGRPQELAALHAAFEKAGFEVASIRHYSLFGSFEAAVGSVLEKVFLEPTRPVHLVGFSLGGLIMRAAADACPNHVNSLLLIGTPNAGSALADLLSLIYPTPSIRRLRRAAKPLPSPADHILVGCIAGTRGGWLGWLLEQPNDTRVTVASAFAVRHDYEALVHCNHERLRDHPDVLRHAVAFVRGAAAPISSSVNA